MSVTEDKLTYITVINHELQYSIWPSHKELPLGWSEVDVSGTKEACLDYIEETWVDMRPTAVRIHLECLQRAGQEKPPEPESSDVVANLSGYKVTDSEGRPFADKSAQMVLSEGRTLECRGGLGLHFSSNLEDAVANGVAAAAWDDRYYEELQDPLLSSAKLHADGIKIFEVFATNASRVGDSVYRASSLEVGREVSPAQSKLWPLIQAYRKWQADQLEGPLASSQQVQQ